MRWVDFDIHGLIGIRLVSPSPQVLAAITRQLGPLRKPLLREPDITYRFGSGCQSPASGSWDSTNMGLPKRLSSSSRGIARG